MLSVRKAGAADMHSICDCVQQLAEYEELAHEVTFTEDQYDQYFFKDPHHPHPEVLIAELDNDPVGIALYIHILASTIHLEDLFVNPSARGKGLGIALFARLASEALKRDVSTLEWSCLDWNKPSLEFYASLGAVRIPDRALYRITGESLRHPSFVSSMDEAYSIMPVEAIPNELDKNLKGIELLDRASGKAVCSLFYTLTFTTFKATPVILVANIVCGSDGVDCFGHLVSNLIQQANILGYSRIDVCINKHADIEVARFLVDNFGAFEMEGWIPLSLSGDSLTRLAARTIL